jgi:hypothetical protein
MSNLILHCGGESVTRSIVEAVPVPAATSSYNPVAYGDAIALMHDEARRGLGMAIRSESYGLNKAGDQMFALLTLDTGNAEHGLSIGLRQSYNKTLALGVAIGAQVFVCDNLAFSGSAFKVVRKNTVNVWPDFRGLLRAQIAEALPSYRALESGFDVMRETPCSIERGYAVLGVMCGRELLTPNQASVAFEDWRTPRHAEFADRNVWGLYNAVTEGLKKGAPGRVLDRHAAAHDFVVESLPMLARKAGSAPRVIDATVVEA